MARAGRDDKFEAHTGAPPRASQSPTPGPPLSSPPLPSLSGPARLPEALETLYAALRDGKRPALARAISVVENQRPGFQALLHRALTDGLRARRIGITGPPGAGKSTLVSAMASAARQAGEEVAVVAVDPTSPFSGGALLGDRIRMNELATDPGIFIRSMATRGSLGGLATTTKEVLDLMDAGGFPRVLVETVGVGQTELEIAGAADTTIVVLVPESGDGIQAMKAGLMEIADLFVVNKADRPGADRLVKELKAALHLRAGETLRNVPAHHGVDLRRVERLGEGSADRSGREGGGSAGRGTSGGSEAAVPTWEIPVLTTVAQSGMGVPELLAAVEAHGRHLVESGELERRRRARAADRVREVVERELLRVARTAAGAPEIVGTGLDRVEAGVETPYSLARGILARLLGNGGR